MRLNSLNRLAAALSGTPAPPAPAPAPITPGKLPPPSPPAPKAKPAALCLAAQQFQRIGDSVLRLMLNDAATASDLAGIRARFTAYLQDQGGVKDWRDHWPVFLAGQRATQAPAAVPAAIPATTPTITTARPASANPWRDRLQQRRRAHQTSFTSTIERVLV